MGGAANKGSINPLNQNWSVCRNISGKYPSLYLPNKQKIKINKEEISEGKYLDLAILKKEIQKNPDQFTSSLKLILKNYSEEIKGTQNIL